MTVAVAEVTVHTVTHVEEPLYVVKRTGRTSRYSAFRSAAHRLHMAGGLNEFHSGLDIRVYVGGSCLEKVDAYNRFGRPGRCPGEVVIVRREDVDCCMAHGSVYYRGRRKDQVSAWFVPAAIVLILHLAYGHRWQSQELWAVPASFQWLEMTKSMRRSEWHILGLLRRTSSLEEAMYCLRTRALSLGPRAIAVGHS